MATTQIKSFSFLNHLTVNLAIPITTFSCVDEVRGDVSTIKFHPFN